LTVRTKTEKESESDITMCGRMQMYNIINLFLFENALVTSAAFRFFLDFTQGVEKSGVDVIR
jgi:hypothetical protein